MNVLFLLCLFAINPPVDIPTLNIDGYIEINHFWQIPSSLRSIKEIEVEYGSVIFDQLIIWQYNPQYDRYDILHWDMIKDGRLIHQLNTPEEKEEEKLKIYKKWEEAHIKYAKENKVDTNRVVVYVDSEWVGSKSHLLNPKLNDITGNYDVFIKDSEGTIGKITAKTLVETNTTYDPEVTYRQLIPDYKPVKIQKFSKFFSKVNK